MANSSRTLSALTLFLYVVMGFLLVFVTASKSASVSLVEEKNRSRFSPTIRVLGKKRKRQRRSGKKSHGNDKSHSKKSNVQDYEINSILLINIVGNVSSIISREEQILEDLFLEVYNKISDDRCDDGHRFFSSFDLVIDVPSSLPIRGLSALTTSDGNINDSNHNDMGDRRRVPEDKQDSTFHANAKGNCRNCKGRALEEDKSNRRHMMEDRMNSGLVSSPDTLIHRQHLRHLGKKRKPSGSNRKGTNASGKRSRERPNRKGTNASGKRSRERPNSKGTNASGKSSRETLCEPPTATEYTDSLNEGLECLIIQGKVTSVSKINSVTELQRTVKCNDKIFEFDSELEIKHVFTDLQDEENISKELETLADAFVYSYNQANLYNVNLCDKSFRAANYCFCSATDPVDGEVNVTYGYTIQCRGCTNGTIFTSSPSCAAENNNMNSSPSNFEVNYNRQLIELKEECVCPSAAPDVHDRGPTPCEFLDEFKGVIAYLQAYGELEYITTPKSMLAFT